jgi:fumarylacetoacetate (FAA) hydrolase family protein
MIASPAQHYPLASPKDLALSILPTDAKDATLVGRVELPGMVGGPTPALVTETEVYDLSGLAPTVAELLADKDRRRAVRTIGGPCLGSTGELLAATLAGQADAPRFLAPVDLQCVKACGVTYTASIIERIIEERSGGDPAEADRQRQSVEALIGGALTTIRPGSDAAQRLKALLQAQGAWSHYLEVGIGPDCESFTKCPPLAAVGFGAPVGIRGDSEWNNPEPELVVVTDPSGEIVAAALGNDVNLRDFESRSPMLLDKAKDNTASCAIGPFLRLLDDRYDLDAMRRTKLGFSIEGQDGFALEGEGDVSTISRDLTDLVEQTFRQHQYPDGLVLFTGTMWVPTMTRGRGSFTHRTGDWVQVWSERLGRLANRTAPCSECPPWTTGIAALMRNLARRGLLAGGPRL